MLHSLAHQLVQLTYRAVIAGDAAVQSLAPRIRGFESGGLFYYPQAPWAFAVWSERTNWTARVGRLELVLDRRVSLS